MQKNIFPAVMMLMSMAACHHVNGSSKGPINDSNNFSNNQINNYSSEQRAIADQTHMSSHQLTADKITAGDVSIQQLLSHYPVFEKNYQAYFITEIQQNIIKKWPKNLSIQVYFGSWCHDSEREVPRLLKIVADQPHIQVNLIALDYQKSEPKRRASANQVKYTPTFVVYQNNQEIGRIIERPQVSLIADINNFIQ